MQQKQQAVVQDVEEGWTYAYALACLVSQAVKVVAG
jgi:hypothetical protein